MCRMLGVMCSDADLLECSIREIGPSLNLPEVDGERPKHHGVGVGYYSNDDPLLKRRPAQDDETLDHTALTAGIKSNALLLHVRQATVGGFMTDNTHPFRFRRWLFAHVGHLPALEAKREGLLAAMPPFLARNIRGETDSELAFHMFLSNLFKEGTLNDLGLGTDQLSGYLRECAAYIGEIHEGSTDKPAYAIVVTNGQVMGAICLGEVMHYSHRESIHNCPEHDQSEHERQSHARFKAIMLGAQMTDPGHQWREVTDGSLLTISNQLELKVQQI